MTIPDGWKLVPLEPTDDMVANIRRQQLLQRAMWGREPTMDDKWVYRAMLAAAPSPQKEPESPNPPYDIASKRLDALAAALFEASQCLEDGDAACGPLLRASQVLHEIRADASPPSNAAIPATVTHECGEACPHASDCAVHNAPAYPAGECTCGAENPAQKTITIDNPSYGPWLAQHQRGGDK